MINSRNYLRICHTA